MSPQSREQQTASRPKTARKWWRARQLGAHAATHCERTRLAHVERLATHPPHARVESGLELLHSTNDTRILCCSWLQRRVERSRDRRAVRCGGRRDEDGAGTRTGARPELRATGSGPRDGAASRDGEAPQETRALHEGAVGGARAPLPAAALPVGQRARDARRAHPTFAHSGAPRELEDHLATKILLKKYTKATAINRTLLFACAGEDMVPESSVWLRLILERTIA